MKDNLKEQKNSLLKQKEELERKLEILEEKFTKEKEELFVDTANELSDIISPLIEKARDIVRSLDYVLVDKNDNELISNIELFDVDECDEDEILSVVIHLSNNKSYKLSVNTSEKSLENLIESFNNFYVFKKECLFENFNKTS